MIPANTDSRVIDVRFTLLLTVTTFAFCDFAVAQNSDPLVVQTASVEQRDFVKVVETPATVQGFQVADLYAKVGGYLKEIHVDIGDEVKKDQELAVLDIPEMNSEMLQKKSLLAQAMARVDQATEAIKQSEANVLAPASQVEGAKAVLAEKEALLKYEEQELGRIQVLVSRGAVKNELLQSAEYKFQMARASLLSAKTKIQLAQAHVASARADLSKSKADLKSAQANVDVSTANLEFVKTMMRYATIRAPFDGQVTERWFDPGAFIQSADGNSAAKPIVQVSRTDTVRIMLDLAMNELAGLDRGDPARLHGIKNLPGKEYTGDVSRFSSGLNSESRMMRVQVDLKNEDKQLAPGFFGYVTLTLADIKNALVIPAESVAYIDGKPVVYQAVNSRAKSTPVDILFRDNKHAVVSSGLAKGDSIIITQVEKLSDGKAISQ